MNLKERTYLWYLAVLRIYVGYYMFPKASENFSAIFPRAIGSAGRSAISPLWIFILGTRLSCNVRRAASANYLVIWS